MSSRARESSPTAGRATGGLEKLGYVHQRRSQRAARTRGDPGELLPAVHRVASLIKRWLLGTHQGSVDTAHLTSYLNEFVFRFNRRRSRSRGMVFYRVLELAVAHDPVRYRDLIVDPTPKMKPPAPPRTRGTQPAWNARRRTDHGELPARRALAPVKWIPQINFIIRTLKDLAKGRKCG